MKKFPTQAVLQRHGNGNSRTWVVPPEGISVVNVVPAGATHITGSRYAANEEDQNILADANLRKFVNPDTFEPPITHLGIMPNVNISFNPHSLTGNFFSQVGFITGDCWNRWHSSEGLSEDEIKCQSLAAHDSRFISGDKIYGKTMDLVTIFDLLEEIGFKGTIFLNVCRTENNLHPLPLWYTGKKKGDIQNFQQHRDGVQKMITCRDFPGLVMSEPTVLFSKIRTRFLIQQTLDLLDIEINKSRSCPSSLFYTVIQLHEQKRIPTVLVVDAVGIQLDLFRKMLPLAPITNVKLENEIPETTQIRKLSLFVQLEKLLKEMSVDIESRIKDKKRSDDLDALLHVTEKILLGELIKSYFESRVRDTRA